MDVWRGKAKLERGPAPQSPPLFSKWGGNDEPKSAALALPFAVDKTAQLAPSPPLTSQLLFYPSRLAKAKSNANETNEQDE